MDVRLLKLRNTLLSMTLVFVMLFSQFVAPLSVIHAISTQENVSDSSSISLVTSEIEPKASIVDISPFDLPTKEASVTISSNNLVVPITAFSYLNPYAVRIQSGASGNYLFNNAYVGAFSSSWIGSVLRITQENGANKVDTYGNLYLESIDISTLYASRGAGTYSIEFNIITGTNDYTWFRFNITVASATAYTLTFNANGGSGSMANQTIYSTGSTINPNAFTRAGYTFVGWATSQANANAYTVAYNNQGQITGTGNTTLYAVWRANPTITFNANGGTGTMANQSVAYNTATTLTNNTFTRRGYTFLGWSTSSSATTPNYTNQANVTFTSDTTLYAVWSTTSYTVTFNANGGSGTTQSQSFYTDTSFTLNNNGFTRSGYTFVGWARSASATSATYSNQASVTFSDTGNVTLYAVWAANLTISFNVNYSGGTNPSNISVGANQPYGSLPVPTRTNYRFLGWFTQASNGTIVNESDIATSSRTLYAHWDGPRTRVIIHRNTLDPNNTDVPFPYPNETYYVYVGGTFGDTLTDPEFEAHNHMPFWHEENPNPNFNFIGWFNQDTGGTQVFYDTPVILENFFTDVSNNATRIHLYAQWLGVPVNVTFDGQGGTFVPPSRTFNYYSPYGDLPTPIKTGYTFGGWYDAPSDGNLITSTSLITNVNDHTLYARWTVNTFAVNFYNHENQVIYATRVNYQEPATFNANLPTRENWAFNNWDTDFSSVTSDLNIRPVFWPIVTIINSVNNTIISSQAIQVGYDASIPSIPDMDGWSFIQWSSSFDNITQPLSIYAIYYPIVRFFNGYDNTLLDTQIVELGSNAIEPTQPTREGWTFNGWDSALTNITQPRDINALWQANVTFTDGLGNILVIRQVSLGESAIAPVVSNRIGYTHTGWDTNFTSITGPLVVNATWQPNTYTILFHSNDGNDLVFASKSVIYQSTIGELPIPTREGYTFLGWFDTNNVEFTSESIVDFVTTLNLYASWQAQTFTVSFDGNGGSSPSDMTVTFDSEYGSLPTSNRLGYNFVGWTLDRSTNVLVNEETIVSVASNHTLYGVWSPVEMTVTFNPNGGVTPSFTTAYVSYDNPYNSLPTTTREGYLFIGWFDGSNNLISPNTIVSVVTDHSLIAQWQSIEYNVNVNFSFSDTPGSGSYNFEDEVTIDAGNRLGYTFNGWSVTPSIDGLDLRESRLTFTMPSHNVSFNASWLVNSYNVSISNTSPSIEDTTYQFGSTVSIDAGSRDGYIFNGWVVTSNNVTILEPSHVSTRFVMPAGDVEITATWLALDYNITVNNSFATSPVLVNSEVSSIAHINDVVTLDPGTRVGFDFNGWTVVEGNITIEDNEFIMGSNHVVVNATWTPRSYSVTLHNINGSDEVVTSNVYLSRVSIDAGSKLGYRFNGWEVLNNTALLDNVDSIVTSFIMPSNNVEINATWIPINYSVTVNNSMATNNGSGTSYHIGDIVTINPGVLPGYTFTGWDYDDSIITDLTGNTFTMPASHVSISAIWSPITYNVTIDYFVSVDNIQVQIRDIVNLEAPYVPGYNFSHWSAYDGDISLSNDLFDDALTSITFFEMSEYNSLRVVSNYVAIDYTISSQSFGLNGSILVNGESSNTGHINDEVTVNAGSMAGYEFVRFESSNSDINFNTSDNQATFIMPNDNVLVRAIWSPISYVVSIDLDGNPSNFEQVIDNAFINDTIVLNAPTRLGYTFDGWSTNNDSIVIDNVLNQETFFVLDVPSNIEIYTSWTPIRYSITLNNDASNGSILVDVVVNARTALMNQEVTLNAGTRLGYTFDHWEIDGLVLADNTLKSLSFLMPSNNLVIDAVWSPINYTVSIDYNNGDDLSIIDNAHINSVIRIDAPIRDGYIFNGWTSESSIIFDNENNPSTSFVMIDEDVTIQANWLPINYTITLNNTVANTSVSGGLLNRHVNEDIMINVGNNLGYEFIGIDSNLEQININTETGIISFTMPADNVEITLQWQAINYNVYIDYDGDSVYETTLPNQHINDVVSLNAPSRLGYVFNNWTSDNEIVFNNQAQSTSFSMIASNVYVRANWLPIDYSVIVRDTFNIENNGSTNSGHVGDVIIVSTGDREGYTFNGFTSNISGLVFTSVDSNTYSFIMPASNVEVRGLWTPILYSVSIDKYNTGSPDSSIDNVTIDSIVTLDIPVRSGYTFSHWSASLNGEGLEDFFIDNNTFTMIASNDLVITGHWDAINYNVTLRDTQNDTVITTNNHVNDLVMISAGEKEGYTFSNWSVLLGGVSLSNLSSNNTYFRMPASHVELRANWTPIDYSVTVLNTYPSTPVNEQAHINQVITLDAGIRPGYIFSHWSSDSDIVFTNVNDNMTTFTMIASDVEVSANWTYINYSISLDGAVSNTSVSDGLTNRHVGESVILDPGTKAGYGFIGFTSNDVEIIDNSFVMPASNVGITLNWQAINYNVVINDSNGSNVETATINQVVSIDAGTKLGYTFNGWLVNSENVSLDNKLLSITSFVMVDDNVEITALWTPIKYNVVVNQSFALDTGARNDAHINDVIVVDAGSRTGYTFGGFSSTSGIDFTLIEDTDEDTNKASFIMPAHNVEIFVSWNAIDYNVTVLYSIASITGEGVYHYNDYVNIFAGNNPGFIFNGWVSEDLDTFDDTLAISSFIMPDHDVSVQATWLPIDYKVTVNNSFASVTGARNDAHINDVVSIDAGSRPGYIFTGWYAAGITLDNPTSATTSFVMPSDNVTVNATWQALNYQVIVEGSNAATSGATTSAQINQVITINAGSRAGYRFIGWTSNNEAIIFDNASSSYTNFVMVDSNVTVSAQWKAIDYLVTINNTYPSTPNIDNAHVGNTINLNAGSRTGYTFIGWSIDNDIVLSNNPVTSFTMPSNNVEVTALWQANNYTVSVSGSRADNSIVINQVEYVTNASATYGQVVRIQAGTRNGYDFTGWRVTGLSPSDLIDDENNTTTFIMPANNVTIEATWDFINYSVSINDTVASATERVLVNGITNESAHMGDTIQINAGHRPGFNLSGWDYILLNPAISVDGHAGATVNDVFLNDLAQFGSDTSVYRFTMPNYIVQITALWDAINYSVLVDLDGDRISDKVLNDINIDDTVSLQAPSRPGYAFVSWHIYDNDTNLDSLLNNPTSTNTSFIMPALDNLLVTTQWSLIDYSISVLGSNVSSPDYVSSKLVDNVVTPTNLGNINDVITINAGVRPGYVFNGWTATINGIDQENTFFNEQSSSITTFIMPDNNVEVTASWVLIPYTLNISNNVNNTELNTNQFIGDTVLLNALDIPGYTFSNWSVTNDLIVLDNPSHPTTSFVMINSNVSIQAIYTPNIYTISVNNSNAFNVVSVNNEDKNTASINDNVIVDAGYREGYSLLEGNEFTTNLDSYTLDGNSISFSMPPKHVVITANWYANDYSVSISNHQAYLDGLDISGAGDNYNIGQTITINAGVKPGYQFSGWEIDETSSAITLVNASHSVTTFIMPAGNVSLNATWSPIDYTVSVNNSFALVSGATNTAHINDVITIDAGTRPGYSFNGFTSDVTLDVNDNKATFTMIDDHVSITVNWLPIDYSVSILNTFPDSDKIDNAHIGDTISINAGSRVGYTFNGWTSDNEITISNPSASSTSFVMIDEDVTISASWLPINYHITLINTFDGSQSHSIGTIESGLISINPGSRLGYTFNGWNILQGDISITNNSFVMVASDVVIQATWQAIPYTVTINGIDSDPIIMDNLNINDLVTLYAPTRQGYTFNGWSTNNEAIVLPNNPNTSFNMPASNVEVTALWLPINYNVIVNQSFTDNDGSTNSSHINDVVVVSVDLNGRSGYHFNGFIVNSGNISLTTINEYSASFIQPANDVTITASWVLNEYSVTVDNTFPATSTITDATMNQRIQLQAGTRSGYTFDKWIVNAGGISLDDVNNPNTSFVMGTSNVAITATWLPINYNVIVNNTFPAISLISNVHIDDVVNIQAGSRLGYTFNGWEVVSGNVSIDNVTSPNTSFVMGDNDVVVQATWLPINYTVNILNTGGLDTTLTNQHINDTISINAGTRPGYTFDTWTSDQVTITNPRSTNTSFVIGELTNDVTSIDVRASWLLNTYTITLNNVFDGSSQSLNSATIESGSITINPGTRAGYSFSGWTGNVEPILVDTNNYSFDMIASNVVLSATWIPNPHSVTIDGNGSTGYTPLLSPVYMNDSISISAGTKSGYGFNGWSVLEGNITLTNPNNPNTSFIMVDEDVLVQANWTAITYTVSMNHSLSQTPILVNDVLTNQAIINNLVSIDAGINPGHQFLGWSIILESTTLSPLQVDELLVDSSSTNTSFTMPAGNVSVTALWQAYLYDVRVNDLGEGGSVQVLGVDINQASINNRVDLYAGSKPGYTFNGWVVNSENVLLENNSFISTSLQMPSDDIEITATWLPIIYTVNLIDGGLGSSVSNLDEDNTSSITINDTISLNPGTRAGYTFNGWSVLSGDVSITSNTFTMPSSNVSIRALWSVDSVSLNVVDNLGNSLRSENIIYGSLVRISAPVIEGYRFIEFTTNVDLTNSDDFELDLSVPYIQFDMPSVSTVITINYKAIAYSVNVNDSYSLDNGTTNSAHINDEIIIDAGTRPGYIFLGFEVVSNNVDITYEMMNEVKTGKASFIMPSSNVVINTLWEAIPYSLTVQNFIDNNYSDSEILLNNATVGDSIALEVGMSGYIFDGWSIVSGSIELDYPSSNVINISMLSSDLVLRADWISIDYTVTVNNSNASVTGARNDAHINDEIIVDAGTRLGYTFDGISISSDIDVTRIEGTNSYTFIMPADNVSVTFNWTPIQYSVSVIDSKVLNNGSGNYIINDVVNINAGSQIGYTFTGWTMTQDGVDVTHLLEDASSGLTRFMMPDGNVVVTANWEVISYTVRFMDGGYVLSSQSIEHGNDALAPSMNRQGYHYSWDKAYTNITSNTDIFIVWEIDTFNVSFYDEEGYLLSSQIVNYGDSASAPSITPRNGYSYTWDVSYDNVTTDLVVRLVWSINTYTVRFIDENNVLISSINIEYSQSVPESLRPTIPPRYGYVYMWSNALNGSSLADFTNVTSNRDYFLVWSRGIFNVVFKDGFSDTIISSQRIPYQGSATPPSNLTRLGYRFNGWDNDYTNIDSDTTINALWLSNSHNISIDLSDYNDVVVDGSLNVPINYDDYILDSDLPNLHRPGFILDGWTLDNVRVDETTTLTSDNDIVLRPIFKPMDDIVLTLVGNGGFFNNEDTITINVLYDDVIDLSNLEIPVNVGYPFINYSLQASRLELFDDSNRLTNDLTLYAIWSDTETFVTVSIEIGDNVSYEVLSYNEIFNLDDPVKDNQVFVSWLDLTTDEVFVPGTRITNDLVIRALFRDLNTYNVTFNLLVEGQDQPFSINFDVSENDLVSNHIPTVTNTWNSDFINYINTSPFTGDWYDSHLLFGPFGQGLNVPLNDNSNLVFEWHLDLRRFDITFVDPQVDLFGITRSVPFGSRMIEPTVHKPLYFVPEGHVYGGWWTNVFETEAQAADAVTTATERMPGNSDDPLIANLNFVVEPENVPRFNDRDDQNVSVLERFTQILRNINSFWYHQSEVGEVTELEVQGQAGRFLFVDYNVTSPTVITSAIVLTRANIPVEENLPSQPNRPQQPTDPGYPDSHNRDTNIVQTGSIQLRIVLILLLITLVLLVKRRRISIKY